MDDSSIFVQILGKMATREGDARWYLQNEEAWRKEQSRSSFTAIVAQNPYDVVCLRESQWWRSQASTH